MARRWRTALRVWLGGVTGLTAAAALAVVGGALDGLTVDGSVDRGATLWALVIYWLAAVVPVLAAAALLRDPRRSLLACGAVALTLAAAEPVLRWTYPPASRPLTIVRSAEAHHAIWPMDDAYVGYYEGRHVTATINADGIRDHRSPAELRRGAPQILFLGDSFTFGAGVQDDEAFPMLLQSRLRRRLDDRDLTAVDAGVPSYSPFLARLQLARMIDAGYRPDLVVYTLDVTDVGDDLYYESVAEDVGGRTVFWGGRSSRPPPYCALARLWFGSPVFHAIQASHATTPLRLVGARAELVDPYMNSLFWYRSFRVEIDGVVETNRFFVYRHPLSSLRPHLERTERQLRAIAALARGVGAPLLVAVLPRYNQWDESGRECPDNWEGRLFDLDEPFEGVWIEYFTHPPDDAPYQVVDLLPALGASGRFPLVFPDDPHLAVAGHEVVAAALVDAIAFLLEPASSPPRDAGAPAAP